MLFNVKKLILKNFEISEISYDFYEASFKPKKTNLCEEAKINKKSLCFRTKRRENYEVLFNNEYNAV